MVENATRQKTPNEIAPHNPSCRFYINFYHCMCDFAAVFHFMHIHTYPYLHLFLCFVCLIPTTIGGYFLPLVLQEWTVTLRANVIAKSGKAVETAGRP